VKYSAANFKGMMPLIGNTKLPDDWATTAVNCKLTSGDIEGYLDIGNPFQLAKPAPIIALERAPNLDWYQFTQTDLASFAYEIRMIPGIVPGDTTGRRYITGYAANGGVPQFTNTFFGTDPSQQGSNLLAAYPYATFPLGVPDPTAVPTASAPPVGATATAYDLAQMASVNNAVVAAAGTGYVVGDKAYISGGTLSPDFTQANGAAQVKVTTVSTSGAITGLTLLNGGFYTAGNGPGGSTGGTVALIGGSGTGATVTTTNVGNSFTGLGVFSYNNGAGSYSTWSIDSTQALFVTTGQGDLTVAYTTGAFSLQTAQTYTVLAKVRTINSGSGDFADLVVWLGGIYTGGRQLSGPAIVLSKTDGLASLFPSISGSNGGAVVGTAVGQQSVSVTDGVYYVVTAQMTAETAATSPGFSVMATIALESSPTAIVATLTGFVPYAGESVGVGSNHRGNHNDGNLANFKDIYISVSQPASEITVESTNYVVTDVQNLPGDPLTQESGPSDPSATIDVDIDGTQSPPARAAATIVIQPSQSGRYITYRNLYRLVEDSSGDETYTLVTVLAAFNLTGVTGAFTTGETVTGSTSGATATVISYNAGVLILSNCAGLFSIGETITGSISQATGLFASSACSTTTITYVDSASDSDIGPDILISQTWAPPPAQMQGIVAGPNGIMFGYVGNILCCSAQNYPHAWPVENQYATDTNLTSATPIDTSLLLTTMSFPYTAWGTDPSAFSMSKEVSIQGCVAPRGVVTQKRGVVFPSGNGYCYYKGQGILDLVRPVDNKPPFSYEQWQALSPSSIIAIMHDDYLFWFSTSGTYTGGWVLDLNTGGFCLIQLDFHVSCLYLDKATDTLYLVPDYSVFPINGSVVAAPVNVVSQWEAAATYRSRSWTRLEKLFGYEVSFQKARIQSANTGTVSLNAYSEQGTAYNLAVTQQGSFCVACMPGFRWNFGMTMTGAILINTLELAESIEELQETQP